MTLTKTQTIDQERQRIYNMYEAFGNFYEEADHLIMRQAEETKNKLRELAITFQERQRKIMGDVK